MELRAESRLLARARNAPQVHIRRPTDASSALAQNRRHTANGWPLLDRLGGPRARDSLGQVHGRGHVRVPRQQRARHGARLNTSGHRVGALLDREARGSECGRVRRRDVCV